jgi:hypothetical protein
MGRVSLGAGGARFVASTTRRSVFEVAPKGLAGGIKPRRSRWQFSDAAGEIDEAGLISEGARQRDFDGG